MIFYKKETEKNWVSGQTCTLDEGGGGGVEFSMAELRLKDNTNENKAQDTSSNSKTEAAKFKNRTSCGSDEKPSESDNVTSETKASERGLSSSDSGEEIPKEICDAAREEGSATTGSVRNSDVFYHIYENELTMPDIMRLIQKDLSEPYSIYTYRYFIHNWPNLCFMR